MRVPLRGGSRRPRECGYNSIDLGLAAGLGLRAEGLCYNQPPRAKPIHACLY